MNKTIIYSKIGENRGRKRIWIEGQRLAKAGFSRYQKYIYQLELGDKPCIKLILSEQGDRAVAGRTRNGKDIPIIDLCSGDITAFSSVFERVKVVIEDGLITITPHHLDVDKLDRENRAKTGTVKTGTICSGAGIATKSIHQGLSDTGIKSSCEWLLDREGAYLEVADSNHDVRLVIQGEVEEVESVPTVDLLQVSLPCTGHSKSGKSKNKITIGEQHPTDATAVIGMLNLIKSANPSVIISENVTEAQNSASYALIRGYLTKLGYKISEFSLDGEFAGTIEQRKRYWFVATSESLPAFDPDRLQSFPRIHDALSDILEDIPHDSSRWKEFNYLADKEKRDIAAGKGFKRQIKSANDSTVGTIGRHYAKCRSTEPFIKNPTNETSRLLTPIEHARVKRVPLSFVEGVADTTAHQVLGQSILYTQGQAIGRAVGEWFNSFSLRTTAA